MDCHATAQKPVNNCLQSLYHLLKPSLIMLTTIQPKIILQLTVITIKLFHELYNEHAIVHEGTAYPSNHNPMGVPISEYVCALNVETRKNTYLLKLGT